ncbi:membrane protein [Arthrobacter phage Atuin]|nr:membrane protein [Arthrobacter phage Atuin]
MRLRDTFKYFCAVCWVCFSILSLVWLFFVGIFVIALVAGQMIPAAWMAFALALAGSGLVWVSVSEARDHYEGRA